jgi:hypothetical protein
MANAARDENRVPTLLGASDVDGTPVILLADPVTGRLKVTSTGGGGGGDLTTAAKGATAAGSPTSTNASTDRQPLDVTLRDTSGNAVAVGGGTQYTEGDVDASITGTAMMAENGGDTLKPLQVDSTGHLIVHQSTENVALPDGASNTRHIVSDDSSNPIADVSFGYGYNGTTWDRLRANATDGLLVNLGSNNDVTVASLPLPSGAATATNQLNEIDILNLIQSAVQSVAGAKGVASDLRVTIVSGTVTTVATVTTVSTVSNQTNIGGIAATTLVPSISNSAAVLSNINNIVR